MEHEVEGSRPRGRPKKTWKEVVREDCQARKLNKEDAMDRCKWRKMIRIGVSGWKFLLVPAYPGCPGSKAVKRSLLLLLLQSCVLSTFAVINEYKCMNDLIPGGSPSFFSSIPSPFPVIAPPRFHPFFSSFSYSHLNSATKSGKALYIGWSDVTESMVTIRSPFCGYNTK